MNKRDILLENGTFNRNHSKVTEQRFTNDDFYDPCDLAQVKYEMLRIARESQENISEIITRFGFSRAGFYKIKKSFESEGFCSFVSNKSGPRNAWKLTREHQHFIDSCLVKNPDVSSGEIVSILKAERGLDISKRTIERYRSRKSGRDRKSR